MKYVGFVKEHNNIMEAIPFDSIIHSPKSVDEKFITSITNYLNKGVLIFGWMRYLEDLENGKLMCPEGFFTDGVYVWPMYFSYYISKYKNYPIDKIFFEFIYSKNFINDVDKTKLDMNSMEKEVTLKLYKR